MENPIATDYDLKASKDLAAKLEAFESVSGHLFKRTPDGQIALYELSEIHSFAVCARCDHSTDCVSCWDNYNSPIGISEECSMRGLKHKKPLQPKLERANQIPIK